MFSIVSRLVFPDGVYMSSTFWSAETHLDSQGNTVTTLGAPSKYLSHCFSSKAKDIDWGLIIVFAILMSFILDHHFLNWLYAFLFSIPAFFALVVIFPSLIKLLFQEKTTTARYHTALHQVMNAYQILQRIPTLEEAKNSPTTLKYCFIHKNFQIILRQLPVILVTLFFNGSLASLISLLVFYLVWELFVYPKVKDMKFMYFLDSFVLAKPTDKELEVVLECLNSLMDIPYDGFQGIYRA